MDDKLGADGAIGGSFVAKAPPDGYTLFLGGNTSMLGVPVDYAHANPGKLNFASRNVSTFLAAGN